MYNKVWQTIPSIIIIVFVTGTVFAPTSTKPQAYKLLKVVK